MKNHRDYSAVKNSVKSGFQSRQTAFDAHDFESRSSANSATLAYTLKARLIIIACIGLVKDRDDAAGGRSILAWTKAVLQPL
ncbi:MAG: hypothetical protein ACOX0F_05365 [Syntrophomonadaceae bacterium]|jgi:hypothetical protein